MRLKSNYKSFAKKVTVRVKGKPAPVRSCLLHHEDLRKSDSYSYLYACVIGRNN